MVNPANVLKDLANRFGYHKPQDEQTVEAHEAVREIMMGAADEVSSLCPPSRELALALTKLEEAMFWANAAIARMDAYGERL
jgi:hypothetical protein